MEKLTHVLESAIYASNLDECEVFYTRLLEREPYHHESGRFVFYKLDQAMFLIFDPESTRGDNEGIPNHGASGPGHVCFRISEDRCDAWKTRLAELGIPLEKEYVWPNGAISLYFRDPAQNSIELAPWRLWNCLD